MRTIALVVPLLLVACSAGVEVQTDPVSESIPVTSIGVNAYAEVAFDVPPEAQGQITVEEVSADATLVNPSSASTMRLSLLLSTVGTASPGTPYLFTDANPPPELAGAATLIAPTSLSPGEQLTENLESPALTAAIQQPRLWIIVSNTVTQLGLGDGFPLELEVQNLIVHARVNKSFDGLGAGADVSGL